MREPTQEQFLRDVARHVMTEKLDQGIYRHLRFRQPDNGNMWFDVTTWPGYLVISGDMGTWAFSRVDDMFKFFRSDKGLWINASYWSEKLQNGAHGGHREAKRFDVDVFWSAVFGRLDGYELTPEDLCTVQGELEDLKTRCDNEYACYTGLADFRIALSDFWDHNLEDYTYHFIWCLYAIVWGIQQYDAAKAANPSLEVHGAGGGE